MKIKTKKKRLFRFKVDLAVLLAFRQMMEEKKFGEPAGRI